ncbi:popeye domain-containing protein 3-like isoform X2 [Oratosquilla oratoria]|uniref:popeye domain-containing protein 3-like isoform X2 n=1 Tax=Oratosquilla oratoria TaxID=337810 RepID=UPI003F76B712
MTDVVMTEYLTESPTESVTMSETEILDFNVSEALKVFFNDTSEEEESGGFFLSNSTFLGSLLSCEDWSPPQHLLFQLANGCFFVSYLAPSERKGLLFMHAVLILGFLLYSTWAWNIICAPDVFSWNFSFVILNMGQALHIIYQMRPVKVNKELEAVYTALFEPLNVPRLLFKRLVAVEYAQIMTLHPGEAYAMQNLTRTDRLGLLISGKINVMSDNQFLHSIGAMQFLDSPEFESSRASLEDKFKVSIIAASTCRYVFWQRSSLEYQFVKEPYLASVLSTLIARDITTKLYAMNQKIVTEKGSHLDIRLPSLTSSLSSSCGGEGGSVRSPARSIRSGRSCGGVAVGGGGGSSGGGGGGGGGGSGSGAGGSSTSGTVCGMAGSTFGGLVGVGGLGSLGSSARQYSRNGYSLLSTTAPGEGRLDLSYRENGYVPNGRPEMTPLTELPSTDSLAETTTDIQSWLEDSSRYAQERD